MLKSVSRAIGRQESDLVNSLRAYDDDKRPMNEDFWTYGPKTVLSALDVDIGSVSFAGTCWFHGTRTLEPDRFTRHGILALPDIIDWLWDSILGLVSDEIDPTTWEAFRRQIESGGGGHYANLYRLKLAQPVDQGPLGELVRDVFLNPGASGSHDYLGTPEIVEDIAIEAKKSLKIDIGPRFTRAAKPCLVEFQTQSYDLGALNAALVYGMASLAGEPIGRGACCAYSGKGKAIPACDVLSVEVVS
ncbi:MAG: hypothetical protein KGI38_12150 [Thaumarchaeota archaeon]|nr:hypothetical protein [Nitrososphaerota archaeon]